MKNPTAMGGTSIHSGPERRRLTAELRKSHLLDAAVRVFSANGFRGAKTKDIATEAGINEALLFRHFESKDHLYAAILEEKANQSRVGEALQAMARHADARADEAYFAEFAHRLLDWYKEEPDFLRLMLYSALEQHELASVFRRKQVQPFYDCLSEYIRMRQAEGAFRPMRPVIAVRAFVGMVVHHALVVNVFGEFQPKISTAEAVRSFTSIFVAGLIAGCGVGAAQRQT
jgi:AcrR family transcriptional regulator